MTPSRFVTDEKQGISIALIQERSTFCPSGGMKASIIYEATGNLPAVQILLGHTKIENRVRYRGVDVEDALRWQKGLRSDQPALAATEEPDRYAPIPDVDRRLSAAHKQTF